MAGLTKEQKAEREAAKLANSQTQLNPEPQEPHLVIMVRDEPEFRDGPLSADVHPDEIENWQGFGWKLEG